MKTVRRISGFYKISALVLVILPRIGYSDQSGLSPKEQEAALGQMVILNEILELYATEALDRPADMAACVQEMMAMNRSGKCSDKFTHYWPPEKAKSELEAPP